MVVFYIRNFSAVTACPGYQFCTSVQLVLKEQTFRLSSGYGAQA